MNDVNYLVGTKEVSNRPLEPYAEEVCAFLTALSEAFMKDTEARNYSDIMSFAFWCRKANLMQKKRSWEKRAEKRLGRGLVFHIAPSNVPVNFAFSYAFSLLAGNANLVRLPSRTFPQVEQICRVMQEVLEFYPEVKIRTAFVQYSAKNEITEQFSSRADARVIWGGDNTITTIRSCKTKPRGIDIVFPDRYSICILDGQAILETDSEKLKKLAEAFYNDTYQMDQNACSSPQIIFWKHISEAARERFWNVVFAYAKRKYSLQSASCVDKYLKFCQDAVEREEVKRGIYLENVLYRIELGKLPLDLTALRGSCGYFYEYSIENYQELLRIFTEKFQTITYYGIDPIELQNFIIQNGVRGVDRIVPIGKALDMDVVWDGYHIVEMLSRIVEVR